MKKIIIAFSFLSYLFSIDVTSGGGLSKDQQGIDIVHYDIRLKDDAKRKMISGYTDIKIKVIDEICVNTNKQKINLIFKLWICC